MAQPLSFRFFVHADAVAHVSEHLVKAFKQAADAHPLPNIVHYLWLVPLGKQVEQPLNSECLLLNTVYDEAFKPYVEDIARANPQVFDAVLPKIIGMEKMVPVLQHLNEFANFILAHDLTQGGTTPTFRENYTQTVMQIWGQ